MRKEILKYVIIAILLPLVSVILILVMQNQSHHMEQDHLSRQLGSSFAVIAIKTGLSEGLMPLIDEALELQTTAPDFVGGVVFDGLMTPLRRMPKDYEIPAYITEQLNDISFRTEHPQQYLFHYKNEEYLLSLLRDEDQDKIGFLLLTFSDASLKASRTESLILAFVIAIIFGFPAVLFIAWWISRKLKLLIKVIGVIQSVEQSNNFSLRIPLPENIHRHKDKPMDDEISKTAIAFNRLLETLSFQYQVDSPCLQLL